MNRHRILIIAATAATLAAGFARAYAQDLSASPDIVRGSVDGHAYRNGGVGDAEAAQMHRHTSDYSLLVGFSEGRHNAYLASVKLDVYDTAGKDVFSLRDAGPLVDVQLPAGRYRVVARAGGVARSAHVDVKRGEPARLYLHWAKDPAAA